MNSLLTKRYLWTAAALSLIIGIGMAIRSAANIRDKRRILQTYAELSLKLDEERAVARRNQEAVAFFRELPDPHPTPVAQMLKESFPGEEYEMVERRSPGTIEGWAVRRVEVSFGSVQLSRLAGFLTETAPGRPPWRVTTCAIRSLDPNGGSGQVTLILEALDRQ